jgi:hypothetical protein
MKSLSEVTTSSLRNNQGVAIQSATVNRADSTPDASGLGPWERSSMAARQKPGSLKSYPGLEITRREK